MLDVELNRTVYEIGVFYDIIRLSACLDGAGHGKRHDPTLMASYPLRVAATLRCTTFSSALIMRRTAGRTLSHTTPEAKIVYTALLLLRQQGCSLLLQYVVVSIFLFQIEGLDLTSSILTQHGSGSANDV
ncbi:hypothetical protein EVAR_17234_1 [Eumeta japonica]|uniref:Uncharacterized protein n=1 Tax=Eumeta variegata TaxID=151549 RepID=A0A4C1U9V1_EUMVA|nr:hypothetical protein EVAR_17234_1 [Eumeta japonica]